MFKKTVLAMLLVGASFSSMANWVGGVGYINVSGEDKSNDTDISLNGVVASLGYEFPIDNNLYVTPEFRLGTGIGEDSYTLSGFNVDVEMDHFVSFSLRSQYEFNNRFYIFVAPSYSNLKLTAKAERDGFSAEVSDDSWDFGFGGGAGYRINQFASAEFMYEEYEDTEIFSLGVKLNF